MQIMPTLDVSVFSSTAISNVVNYGGLDSVFADELEAQEETVVEESYSARVALNTAPYSLVSTNTTTYTIDEVCFTKKELQELEEKLKQEGAPDATLEGLRELIDLPDGANLGQVLASLQQQRDYESLSEDEITAIKGFASRVDPSGELGDTLLAYSNAQDGEGLLNALVDVAGSVNGRIDISRGEMAALAKAAGLSSTASAQLQGNFGPYDAVQLNKVEMQTFLSPGMSDFAKEASEQDALQNAMDAVLGPMMSAAKERMEAEEEATALQGRKSQQSQIRIQDNVLQNVNRNIENARAAQMNSDAVQSAQAHMRGQEKNMEQMTKGSLSEEHSGEGTIDSISSQKNKTLLEKGTNTRDAFADQNDEKGFASNEKNNGWETLLGKTEMRVGMEHLGSVHTNNITTPVLGVNMPHSFSEMTKTNPSSMPTTEQTNARQMSAQMAAQVEQSILSSTAEGHKSIELQLHPAELGTLSILLTSRNGEVSAMISSDKAETTELLNQHLDQLRLNLEQQGVKLDKIEVENREPENNTKDLWDGMKEHNARQEENTRRETLERLRALSSTRNNGTSLENVTLEQYMHSEEYVARNAAQSLYIVA